MAVRRDIVNRDDEFSDQNCRYTWKWSWIYLEWNTPEDSAEKSLVKSVRFGQWFRKLAERGKAYCIVCRTELRYANRGVVVFTKHANGGTHQQRLCEESSNSALPDKIPTAPQNVSVQFEGNTLIVTWFKPRRNADRVTSYTIYYNYTGHAQAAAETIIGAAKFRHALQKVEGGHTYNIWMTAENQEVGRSQASAMLIIDMEAGTTEADGNEKQTGLSEGEVAGVVVGVLLVVIAVSVLVVYLVRRNGSGKLKLVESVGFENASYDNAAVQIKNLPGSYDKF